MKKQLLMLTAALLTSLAASASATWTLQSKQYTVDTVYHAKIGPGTTRTDIRLTGGSNLAAFYTVTDLTNPYVEMRVAKGANKYAGNATLSTMAKNNTREGARYFAGVNADFFSGNVPVGSTVVDGEPFYASNNGWTHWYINDQKVPGIQHVNFSGTAYCGESRCAITGINRAREQDNLIIYTPRYTATTATNQYGAEVTIFPIEGNLSFTGKSKYRVGCDPNNNGSMAIPSGGYVLSGHGTAATFVRSLSEGAIVELDMTTSIATGGNIVQMAGGQPQILGNGIVLDTQGALDHLTALNPRTAIGFNADRTKLILLVVDGRGKNGSVGVVSRVLADMMRELGCSDALNFDGGGSSELYCLDFGVINSPSDGNERSVTDAVFAVATAPADNEIAEIQFKNPKMTLPRYGYYTPVIYGYNKYGVLVSTNVEGYTLSCDEALGQVTADGATLFANGTGYHALTATYNGATCSMPVTIGSAQPHMRIPEVIVDSFREYRSEVVANIDGTDMAIDNKALTWSSADSSVATVDDEGCVKGVTEGTTTITGTVGEFADTYKVNVQIPSARRMSLGLDPADWTLSSVMMSTTSLTANPDGGMNINYTIKSKRGNSVTIKKQTQLYALPDSIRLVFNPGDAAINKITFNASVAGGRSEGFTFDAPAITANQNNIFSVAVSDFADPNDFAIYPFEFYSIQFGVEDAAGTSHTIVVPELQSVYTALPEGTEGIENATINTDSTPIAPAIVNAGQPVKIMCADAQIWHVYSLNGAVAKSGTTDSIDTTSMTAGAYIVTVTCPGRAHSAKLIVR